MQRNNVYVSHNEEERKKRIVKCLVWSVATYAAETWTLREVDRKKMEAFEMWIWRQMEKISWSDKITNDDVLKRVNEERSLLNGNGNTDE